MKKSLLIIALIVIAVGTLNIYLGPGPENTQERVKNNLPWQIEITPEGNTRVFEVEVGKTTVEAATKHWRVHPEIALFKQPDGSLRLESYLGKITLPPFDARIILKLDADQATLEQFEANSTSIDPTPSGSYQLRLSGNDFEKALQMPIRELSYSPAVDTDTPMLAKRFDKPDNIIQIDENSSYWLYPQRGLVMLINNEDKEVFHYFPPRDYEDVINSIELLKQNKAELPEADGQ